MANCVTKYFTKKGTTFTETRGVVIAVKISDTVTWDFYSGNNFVAFEGGVPYVVGKWQCDGDENFTITGDVTKRDGTKKNQTFSSKTPDKWTDTVQTTQLDPAFSCVTNGLTSMGKIFEIIDNKYVVATLKSWSGTKWYFYQTKPGVRPWVEVFGGKNVVATGTWSCVGESNFQLTRSDGKTYVGGNTSWEGEGQPDPSTEPEGDDSFPLKEGKRGPNVVKLQKFLNDKIPSNPLTVNGVFDEKTKNKLIEYQKKEGII
jgi:hypothetical protein